MSLSIGDRIDGATDLGRAIVTEIRRENVSFMAGSIAYSAFVSLLPMLLLALLVATAVGGEAFADRVLALTRSYLTPAAQGLVSSALTRASRQTGFSLLGIAVLVWSVLKVFRGLDVAFSSLYHTPRRNDLVDQVVDGVVVLAGIGIGTLAMVAAGLVPVLLPNLPYVDLVSGVALIAALTVAFLPIYYVFPDVDLTVTDVLPGTVVAALGWTVLQAVFQVYVELSSASELYGVIGGIILLVTWLYFGALVLLVGAATNVVLSGRSQTARPAPNPGGRRSPE